MIEQFFTIAQFCERASISRPTFYREVARGKLHAVKVAGATRVTGSEIQRYMAACSPLVSQSGMTAHAPESRAAA